MVMVISLQTYSEVETSTRKKENVSKIYKALNMPIMPNGCCKIDRLHVISFYKCLYNGIIDSCCDNPSAK
jgi:hypothetical protein